MSSHARPLSTLHVEMKRSGTSYEWYHSKLSQSNNLKVPGSAN